MSDLDRRVRPGRARGNREGELEDTATRVERIERGGVGLDSEGARAS